MLDNFESVIAVGKPIVLELLRAGHKLLVSSREALDLPGERVIELPPLRDGDGDGGDEALTLFLQHAGRHDPPLVLDSSNEAAIRALVRATSGIPLAIELAARRASVLGPAEVLARIEEKGGIGILSRPGHDRHASLERTIDETFRALPDDERRAFLDAAVFRGGFTLEAAATIVDGDVTNLLQSLRDKSLVWLDEPGGRFRMHEVIRDFALVRGTTKSTSDRHAAFFIEWIERVRTPSGVIPTRAQRERVLADVENVRAAAEHALQKGDLEGCVRALVGVAPTLRIYGESHWWAELRNASRGAKLPSDLEARLELVETLMLSLRGRREEAEERAARLAGSASDPDVKLAAAILHVQQLLERGEIDDARAARTGSTDGAHPALVAEWALVSVQTRDAADPETLARLERATEDAERLGDATLLAAAARVRASLELAKGNVPSARAALERERAIAEEAELRPVLAQNVLRFGCCDQLEGDLERAAERFGDALEKMSALELRNRLPRAKALLGLLLVERGDPDRARALFADGPLAAPGRALADHLEGRGPMPALLSLSEGTQPSPWASPLADLDRALRCTVQRTFAGGGPPLRIEADPTAGWFSTGNGEQRVDLSDRPSLRFVLRALLEARGARVESAVLITAGWPGERIREDAARNRLRVAIATLRKLGLEGAIETEGTAYRLRAVVVAATTRR